MKNIYKYAMIASAVLSLAACNDLIESSEPAVDIERAIILTATREGTNPNTRSVRMDDGTTWWGPKEEISVFYGSGSNGGSKFTSKNTTIAEITEFEGSISMSGNKEFWAVYPYSADNSCDGSSIITVIPSQQAGVEGNFSNDAFPAMGKSGSLSMPFYNICGGIKFYVSRADIKSVTFKGNNGEILAGKVKVVFGDSGKPEVAEVLDGKTEVTLTAPDGGTFKAGKYYYMTLLSASLEGGFTMSFTTASETGTLTSDKAQIIKRCVFGVLKDVDSKASNWKQHQIPTIFDFAKEYVKVLDIWEKTVGTIDMIKGENYAGGDYNVENAHFIPSTTTITVGGKTYSTADMFETALRSYLLIRGYNGLDTENHGKGSIAALEGGAVAMSITPVPETHNYYWGGAPFNEISGNGGHLVMDNVHCQVKTDILDIWAMCSLNWKHGQPIPNLCGYSGGQPAGYYGSFCSQRALITYAFFFKYMLDNDLDKGTDVDDNTIIRSELFGDETNVQKEKLSLTVTAGTLKETIEALGIDILNVQELTVSGELNGNDLAIIRTMAGNDKYFIQEGNAPSDGCLEVLDMSGSVLIPGSEIYMYQYGKNYSITNYNQIPYDAFRACIRLKRVVLPDNCTLASGASFFACYALESIIIPPSVKTIPRNCFAACRSLEHVSIPNVTTIEKYAFDGCTSLISLELGDIQHFDDGAFERCTALTSISIPSTNQYYCIEDKAVLSKDKTILYYYPGGVRGKYTTPFSVEQIGSYAFCGSNLDEVIISEGTRVIGSYAFYMSSVASVIISNSVTEIGSIFMSSNPRLTSIVLSNRFTTVPTITNCTALEEIDIPEGVTTIKPYGVGSYCFDGCTSLRKITIPSSLTTLEGGFSKTIITEVHCKSVTPQQFEYYPFKSNATVYVPKGAKAAYMAASKWNVYTIVEE